MVRVIFWINGLVFFFHKNSKREAAAEERYIREHERELAQKKKGGN